MTDLAILELTIGVILAVSLVRPFFSAFRGVEGIVLLPALATLLCVASVAAFGFRPELLPLGFLSLIAAILSLPRIVDVARGLRVDDYGEGNPVLALCAGALLVGVVAFAIVFQPRTPNRRPAEGFTETLVAVDSQRGVTLGLRLQHPEAQGGATKYPMVVVVPPVFGSAQILDTFVDSLVSRGYFAVVFTRPGVDIPARDPSGKLTLPRPGRFFGALSSLCWGQRWLFAAGPGADLEAERGRDLAFVAEYARSAAERGDRPFAYADAGAISVVGFGAGGSAALYAAASGEAERYRAVVAVEPKFFSLRRAPADTGDSFPAKFLSWFGLKRTAVASGPGDLLPVAKVPFLMLVSDRIQELRSRDGYYAGTLRVLRASSGTGCLASFPGAGPADYTDVPSAYPVYSTLAPAYLPQKRPDAYYPQRAAEAVASFLSGGVPSLEGVEGISVEK